MTAVTDPLAALLELARKEAAAAAVEALRAEMLRTRQAQLSGKKMLSLADLARDYGIGRGEAKRLISAGRLKCVERRTRGGYVGQFVNRADAEVVLGGRAKS
jgi:hypothetical protein